MKMTLFSFSSPPLINVAMSGVPVLLSPLKIIIAQWFYLITKTVHWKDHKFILSCSAIQQINCGKFLYKEYPFCVVSIAHPGNWMLGRLYYIANRSIHCINCYWLVIDTAAFEPHSQIAMNCNILTKCHQFSNSTATLLS